MRNFIFLRRYNKIILTRGKSSLPTVYISSILKNLESLGYTLSPDILNVIKTFDISQIISFNEELIANIKKLVGANVKYEPMYPNFPEQVMAMDEAELYINAIIHYISNGRILPKYEHKDRFYLVGECNLKIIDLGTEEEFLNIFKNLISSKTSLSDVDREELEFVFPELINNLPDTIPLKENLAFIAKLILNNPQLDATELLSKYFKTATDVLRLAVALSNGDISLAENTKFKNFTRKERRLLYKLLETCGDINNIAEDMVRYKNQWIRLGEKMHPSEDRMKGDPKVKEVFNMIRNDLKIKTFGGTFIKLFDKGELLPVLDLLKTRPGEFARKLDHILRSTPKYQVVVDAFNTIAPKVSTPVLLQVMTHFKYMDRNRVRTVFPKGNVAKLKIIDNVIGDINEDAKNLIAIVSAHALIKTFKTYGDLGKVYIDPRLKDYVVPFSQRSASKSIRTLARGSKVDIPKGSNTLRSFLYWKEKVDDRVDLDLSAIMYDPNWEYLEHVSYTNLKSAKYQACHSGDITSAPHGASEFIDIDIPSVIRYGGRYILISVYSYTQQPFSEIPECFMGFMSREYPNSGEIYEPKTVINKIDITSSTKANVPIILDLVTNKIIWCDIGLTRIPQYNNLESNFVNNVMIGKAMTTLNKPNLFDLFSLHMTARGSECLNIDEADTVFSIDKGITPYDFDKILTFL